MKVYGPLPVGLCRDRSCLGVAEYRLEPEETTAASCCFCGSTTRPFMQVDGPIHGRHVRCLPGHPRPRGQLYLTLTRAGLRGLNLLPTWTLEQKVPTGMRSAHSSGLASQVIAVCPLSSPSGHRRWTVGGALADFHATAEGQRGQIADADPSLVGALQQPGRALGPVQRCRGDPLVGDQLGPATARSSRHGCTASHSTAPGFRTAPTPRRDRRPPERRDPFDPQQAIPVQAAGRPGGIARSGCTRSARPGSPPGGPPAPQLGGAHG
jgi:hypothetical protein